MNEISNKTSIVLKYWDVAIVDLNRSGGIFEFRNVRLRNCSLHYAEALGEYYVKYNKVYFGMQDIQDIRIP